MIVPKQGIKTNILTIFLILIGIVSLSLLVSQYYFNTKLAIGSTNKTFKLITKNITDHVNQSNLKVQRILNTNISNKNLNQQIDFNPFHPALEDITQIIDISHNIYAIYFAQKDGSFYEVVNMQESSLLFNQYKAPKQTRWTIITAINNKTQYAFLDKNNKLLSKYSIVKKYNPLMRPWYVEAINSKQTIETQPYMFSNLKAPGITYAVQTKQEGTVFAIDFTMKKLNKLLSIQKFDEISEVFLFNKDGNKFASSNAKEKKIDDIAPNFTGQIKFTKEEKTYIENLPALLVSNEKDWAPFDFQSAGKPMGYSVDFIRLLSQNSSLKINFINGYTWSQIIEIFQKNDLDIVQSIYKTASREKLGDFTKPIYSFKNYFITQKDAPEIKSIEELNFKRIAVVKGWSMEKFLKNNYPNIELLLLKDTSSAFLALSQNKADAIIDTKETFTYLGDKLHIQNLKISSWFKEFDGGKAQTIHMLIQKENPLLLSIINKTIDSLTKEQLQWLNRKWFSSRDKNINFNMVDTDLIKALFSKENKDTIQYTVDNNSYFSMHKPIGKGGLFIGIKVDKKVLSKPYDENMYYSLTIALILLLLSVPIIFFATNIIIKPIKSLIIENEKIKNREFNKVTNIETNIIEFFELSNSFVSMSQSIQEYQKAQEKLLDSVIKLIAQAVDAKSSYTGGHCARVPVIAQMLIDEASSSKDGVFKDFKLDSKDELREFKIGAWLHDCGKVTTPEYVVDKATKLETINNRIHEIRTRFEVLFRDAQITYLNSQLKGEDKDEALKTLNTTQKQLLEDFSFIATSNIGGEFMSEDKQERIKAIGKQEWMRNFNNRLGLSDAELLRYKDLEPSPTPYLEKLLSDKAEHIVPRENFDYDGYKADGFKDEIPEHLYNYGELYNLCLEKGTLTPEERFKINEHVIMSIKMLEQLPLPAHLAKIPEYAGTHHETMIGTGYPRALTKEQLSIPARIMAIADIFEALTASDRPYKKAKTISQALKIMSFMVKDEHIDADLFKLFLDSGIYLKYAKEFLLPEQIDDVEI